MRDIAELNMLIRRPLELPPGLRLATDEFCEDWDFVTGNAGRLEKRIRAFKWNLIKTTDRPLGNGVSEISQQAIRTALVHALGRINEYCNAAEVTHIALTQYQWFSLAGVILIPYRIQQGAVLDVTVSSLPVVRFQERLASRHNTDRGEVCQKRKQAFSS